MKMRETKQMRRDGKMSREKSGRAPMRMNRARQADREMMIYSARDSSRFERLRSKVVCRRKVRGEVSSCRKTVGWIGRSAPSTQPTKAPRVRAELNECLGMARPDRQQRRTFILLPTSILTFPPFPNPVFIPLIGTICGFSLGWTAVPAPPPSDVSPNIGLSG